MEIKEFCCNIDYKAPIVIYGTTVGGKIIYQCLKRRGITVDFFCDRSNRYKEFCGIPVNTTDVIEEFHYTILISVTRSFQSVIRYLEKIGYNTVYVCNELLLEEDAKDFEVDANEKSLAEDFFKIYPIYTSYDLSSNGILLPALEVFITEKCTLRCRDCSHLIPRYENPKDYNIDEIIENLKNVFSLVDKISDLIILGGEPLLHKEIEKLLEFCYKEKKQNKITIISNGTVLPTDNLLKTMKRTGTRLRISNYGKYSIHMNDIIKKCQEQKVCCYVNNELWTDMGRIFNHNYTQEELEDIFNDCPFAFDMLLLNGHIFRCAHVAHLNNLKIINSYEHDSVKISDLTENNLKKKQDMLKKYMKINCLYGCQYCNGIKNSISGIEPAIQGRR
nr:radical SAM protein [uncultured Sellimonas sp.]